MKNEGTYIKRLVKLEKELHYFELKKTKVNQKIEYIKKRIEKLKKGLK